MLLIKLAEAGDRSQQVVGIRTSTYNMLLKNTKTKPILNYNPGPRDMRPTGKDGESIVVGQMTVTSPIYNNNWATPDLGQPNAGFDKDRQLTKEEIDKIEADIKLILSLPGCQEIINGALAKANNTENPLREGGVLATLEVIRKQKGIAVDSVTLNKYPGAGAIADGNTADGSGKILLRPRDFNPQYYTSLEWRAEYIRTQELLRAFSVLAELIHHSGTNGAYDDKEMSEALADHLGIDSPKYGQITTFEIARKYSNWWHPKIYEVCKTMDIVVAERNKKKGRK